MGATTQGSQAPERAESSRAALPHARLLAAPVLLAGTAGDGEDDGGSISSLSDAVDVAVTEIEGLGATLVAALPRLLIAIVVFMLFRLIARIVRRVVQPRLASVQGASVATVMTSLITGTLMVVGGLAAASVAFPSVDVSTILGAGGVVALAAGFAFQDIFENLMAGLLLLLRQPFEEGDVVEVDGAVGVVQVVTIRETRIRRFDRQVVIVPNAQVYKNAIRLQTANDAIRSSVIVGVGYDEDLQRAEEVAVDALLGVDGVLADPAPEAFYVDLGGSSVNLDLRYFHAPGQHELRRLQGEVVKAVHRAFGDHDIGIPFPIVTLDAMDGVASAMAAVADGRARAGSSSDIQPDGS